MTACAVKTTDIYICIYKYIGIHIVYIYTIYIYMYVCMYVCMYETADLQRELLGIHITLMYT